MSRIKGDDAKSIKNLFTSRVQGFIQLQRQRRREMRRVAHMLAREEAAAEGNGADRSAAGDAPGSGDGTSSAAGGGGGAGAGAGAAAGSPHPVLPPAASGGGGGGGGKAAKNRNKAKAKAARSKHIERQRQKRLFYVSQFMQPEWLTTKPSFTSAEWFIIARPDGKRCIVVASRGLTTSRTKNGNVLHRWPSELPSGSQKTIGRNEEYTLLDCVYFKATGTYYIVDLMCWKGRLLYDTDAAFRMWWLRHKLSEDCPTAHRKRPANRFAILPATHFPCTRDGLAAAREGSAVDYQRDGLLFYHKEGFYEPGTTPLVRQWKDAACSRYVVNTSGDGELQDAQRVVLSVSSTGSLETSEGQKLGQVTRAHVQQLGLKPGQFLRFRVAGVKWSAVAPLTLRVITTVRRLPSTVCETTLTLAASCVPGFWSASLRSVIVASALDAPDDGSTMIAQGLSFICVALNPTPNHTSAGPVMLMVTTSPGMSTLTPSLTNDCVCPNLHMHRGGWVEFVCRVVSECA